MYKQGHRCIRNVDGSYFVKNGKTNYGEQRLKCKGCGGTFILKYTYQAYKMDTNKWLLSLNKEGAGVRSISRLLKISTNTVINRILRLSDRIIKPPTLIGKEYEVDELATFVGNKGNRIWVAYSLQIDTREVTNFSVGKRTNKTLRVITNSLILSEPKQIFTDKLRNYRSLIPKPIHNTKHRGINHIERKNLSLRTHLKRLNRRTICFSKSLAMLTACLKIYFWG